MDIPDVRKPDVEGVASHGQSCVEQHVLGPQNVSLVDRSYIPASAIT